MGWLRLVSSLKLQVSFAKEPNQRDDILQKRPIILIYGCIHMWHGARAVRALKRSDRMRPVPTGNRFMRQGHIDEACPYVGPVYEARTYR